VGLLNVLRYGGAVAPSYFGTMTDLIYKNPISPWLY
jgi:hypothetical protein